MNSSEWGQFLTTRGFQMHDLLGCGVIDRYPLSVQLVGKPALISSIIVKIHLAQSLKKNYRKEIKNLMKHKGAVSYVGRTLQMVVRTSHMQYPYEFSQTVISLVNYLTTNNIQESLQCPICGQFDPDGLAYYNGVYQKVHLSCIENLLDKREADVAQNEKNGNFLTGLIGALLGGLVGILPSVITVMAANHIYAILFVLIPLCIYYGYRLFRGKMNNAAIVLTIVLSVVFLFLMEYLVLVLTIHQDYGMWLFADCFKVFFDPEFFGEMIKTMGMSALFLVIGIVYSWSQISQNNKKTSTSVQFTRSTIKPIQDAGYTPFKNENA